MTFQERMNDFQFEVMPSGKEAKKPEAKKPEKPAPKKNK